MANDIFNALRSDRMRQEQTRENSARVATTHISLRTTGTGELIRTNPTEFDTPYFDEPMVVSGSTLVRRADERYFQLPRVTAGVFRWQRNERGWYVGAWMYFAVDTPLTVQRQRELRAAEHKMHAHAWGSLEFYTAMTAYYELFELPVSRPIIDHYIQFTAGSFKQLGNALMKDIGRGEALIPPIVGVTPEDIEGEEED